MEASESKGALPTAYREQERWIGKLGAKVDAK
jgi:hypothetical protein